jgi:hypothetical protein
MDTAHLPSKESQLESIALSRPACYLVLLPGHYGVGQQGLI